MKELIESFKYISDIGGKYVLEIITVEASKLYKNKYLRQNYKKSGQICTNEEVSLLPLTSGLHVCFRVYWSWDNDKGVLIYRYNIFF